MRGAFDDEEPEPAQPRRDTELTLGSGMLLGMFFGLVLLCALCFGLGYAVGRRGAPVAVEAPSSTGSDQTISQPAGSLPKPSATGQAGATQAKQSAVSGPVQDQVAEPAGNASAPAASNANAAPAAPVSAPAPAVGAGASAGQSPFNPAQVRPALQPPANPPQPAAGAGAVPKVQPALAPAVSLTVQIAAVSHVEDAQVLVNALRKRGYAVTTRREFTDGLIHVSIGPFSSRDEANKWRMKLLNDGYNAILEQ